MSAGVASQIRFVDARRTFAPRPIRLHDWLTFSTTISLIAGLLTNVRFHLGGLASVGETVLGVVAVFAVMANLANPRFWERRMLFCLCALGVSLLGYVLSDLINATPPDRLIRGWARIAFVILDFIAIWALTRNSLANLFAVCVGDALSTALSYFQETRHDFFYDYKFHMAVPITLFIILATRGLVPRRLASVATGIMLAATGMLHILFDNRLAGAICILIGFVLIARAITASRFRSLYMSLLALALVTSSLAIGFVYTATESSFADRREGSNSYRFSTALAGINAIKRAPFVGLGSWVWDPEMWNVFSAGMGVANTHPYSAGDSMGPHSQLIQAWAEAGVLGLVFFVYYGKLLAESLWMLFFHRPLDNMTPLFLFYLLLVQWDLLFSPFANLHRFHIALGLVISIRMLSEREAWRAARRRLTVMGNS